MQDRVGWDDPVGSFIHEQWLKLVQDAKKVGVVQLKRHYFHGWSKADLQSVPLHGFGDASEKAYRAVVYLRVEQPLELSSPSLCHQKPELPR